MIGHHDVVNEPLPGHSADGAADPTTADAPPAVPSPTIPDAAPDADRSPEIVASPEADGATPEADAVPPVATSPIEPGPTSLGEPATPPQAVHRQNRIAIAGTALLLIALVFGGGLLVGRTSAPAAETVTPRPSPAVAERPTPVASTGPKLESDGSRLGRADAKVVVDYWADYQCPYCSKFAQEVIPQLESRIADGTVALVHHDFAFIGPESFAAAAAVRCADAEGKYWPMHDAVYAAQNGENQGAFSADRLKAIADSVGLEAGAFAACLDDKSVTVGVLDDTSAGTRAGIQSTPTIDVNGNRFLGVPDVAKLLTAIDDAAAGASPSPLPSAAAPADPWAGTPTDGRTAGDASAPVTVELWMDYQATGYADAVKTLEDGLRSRIADGKASVVLRDLAILGDESLVAAAAVRCTEDQGGPSWFVHDILASSAKGAGAGIYSQESLDYLAVKLGLDVRAFDACLSGAPATQAARDETAQGKAKGLTEGPAVIVLRDGKEVGRFSGTIDAAKVLAAIDKKG
jgi:protein-disulfide isomerase